MAEEAMRREEQRDDISSSFFLVIIFCFFVWLINSIFCNRQAALDILSNRQADNLSWDTISLTILSNLVIIPVIIYSLVKKLKLTSWLSIYGLLSNAVLVPLFFIGQDKEMGLRAFISALAIGIPSISLCFSVINKLFGIPSRLEIVKLLKSIPLLTFFGILSIYLLYLCIFNTELGVTIPRTSCWGIIVLPILLHGIISNIIRIKNNIKGLIILFILLLLICYNSSKTPFPLPPFILISALLGVATTLFWLYQGIITRKRVLIVSIETIVLLAVLSLNLGFNYLKINYNKVTHVYNWINTTVEGDEKKYGIVSACDGATIIPNVLDSIDYKNSRCYMNSNKHHFGNDTVSLNECFTYEKGVSKYNFFYIHELEKGIAMLKKNCSTIDTTLQDSLNTYAAIVYDEVRNAAINYFVSGKMYQRNILEPLDKLASLQERELRNELNNLNNNTINASQCVSFNKAFAKTFYLWMIKDVIIQKDSVNIFSLIDNIPRLYYYDSLMPKYINENNNLSVKIDYPGFLISYNNSFTLSDLQANSIDAWHDYITMLFSIHLGILAPKYINSKDAHYANIADTIKKSYEKLTTEITNALNEIKKQTNSPSKQVDTNSSLKEVLSVITKLITKTKIIENKFNNMKNNVTNIKEHTKKQISSVDKEKEEMEESFKNLINNVFSDLSEFVLKRNSIYNGEFIDICEQLYLVSVFHQFETSVMLAEYLDNMYNKRTPFYSVLQKTYKEENSIIKLLNEY